MNEIWSPVAGFEEFYEVSNSGFVRSLKRFARIRGGGLRPINPSILKPFLAGDGYPAVTISANGARSKHYVHRLVATAFIANPLLLLEVNHIDNVKVNNAHTNLEWVSRQENEDHKVKSARTRRGEDSPRSKLSSASVDEIRSALKQGESQASIAKRFAVSQTSISRIKIGVSWVPHQLQP